MDRITHLRTWPLHDVASTRRIESEAAAARPPHTLMRRAGLAVARLALALAPHARRTWVACGPGNNGGDGLEAAVHLQAWGLHPVVTWLGERASAPADARDALDRACAAGVVLADAPPERFDLAIDAILGIGARDALEGRAAAWQARLGEATAPVLAVDVPSGLHADRGTGRAVRATHTLSLLTLKPGLFTAVGRDAAGQVWLDDLGVSPRIAATSLLCGPPATRVRPHASHKGSWGDVAVIGGAAGMTGAALLAGSAALHAGAGRVFVALLDGGSLAVDPQQPELMLREVDTLDFAGMHLACGCGGGAAVRRVLPRAMSTARSLVLDADALNALAIDTALRTLLQARGATGRPTVLTPHPLEAARLLGSTAAQVQADRLAAAGALATRLGCVVALKGSGTVIAAPGQTTRINPTGNARLATAGTGDVLAGWIAARLAAGQDALSACTDAVYTHGALADAWVPGQPLVASVLARHPAG